MKVLTGGARVFGAEEGEGASAAGARSRTPICRQSGAQQIAQTVREYGRGHAATHVHSAAEEILYAASGRGACHIAGFRYPIEPGSGVYIPSGAAWSVENPSHEPLVLVSVCCPEESAQEVDEPARSPGVDPPRRVVHERDCEAIPSGDRQFKLLVDKDLGCRQVTQFVGFIPPSKAPFHSHTYEEAIYILEGTGVAHTEQESAEFGPGTSIYLPPGTRHCLENPGTAAVKLLGVFYPSGSPSARYD
ncbi:MAG TPA: cupin domain-containing protein [Terriglobales bacterium]|nr:cupin domain-containing protein [Terriglobales bacterium]